MMTVDELREGQLAGCAGRLLGSRLLPNPGYEGTSTPPGQRARDIGRCQTCPNAFTSIPRTLGWEGANHLPKRHPNTPNA